MFYNFKTKNVAAVSAEKIFSINWCFSYLIMKTSLINYFILFQHYELTLNEVFNKSLGNI